MHNEAVVSEDLEALLHDDFTDEEVERWSKPTAPLVSILMPVYNAEKYLAAAIESCLAQTYPNWRLFIYDDASTDGSLDIADGYAKEHPYLIRLSRGTERSGRLNGAFAFNALLEKCDAEIVAWQHADDLQDPTRIDKQVVKLLSAKVDIVSCNLQFISADGDHRGTFEGLQYAPPTPCIVSWRHVYSTESVGHFDESYGARFDVVWCRKAKKLGVSWSVLKDLLYIYRCHPEQTVASEEYRQQWDIEKARMDAE